jgi:2-hydroxychromene-2-carboxylate isomerase
LSPRCDPDDPAIKQSLHLATQAAIDDGVFGVPTMSLVTDSGERLPFWGQESLPMLREAMSGR